MELKGNFVTLSVNRHSPYKYISGCRPLSYNSARVYYVEYSQVGDEFVIIRLMGCWLVRGSSMEMVAGQKVIIGEDDDPITFVNLHLSYRRTLTPSINEGNEWLYAIEPKKKSQWHVSFIEQKDWLEFAGIYLTIKVWSTATIQPLSDSNAISSDPVDGFSRVPVMTRWWLPHPE